MTKKNQSFPVDVSTAQILHSLAHPAPIDSIETNVSKALKKAKPHDILKAPTQDLQSVAPFPGLETETTMTSEEYYQVMDSQLAPLEKILAQLEKSEENKIKFKKCLHDLKKGSDKNSQNSIQSHTDFRK